MRHEVKIVKFNRKDFLNANNHIIEIDEWIAIEENDLLHYTSVKSVPDVQMKILMFHLRRSRNKRILLFL